MSGIDWLVLILATTFIVGYGIWKTRRQRHPEGYMLGSHQSHWWTICLSVMATQASAITFLSTPGQAYADGMRFVQFYFGLPIAMLIISILFIPRYMHMQVFTVYEFLESRFDLRTRLLAAFLFLIQRGLGAGITIYAPSIILSSILGWNLNLTILVIGGIVTFYTAVGGTQAVSASHKLQMAVMMGGIVTALIITINSLPAGIGFGQALEIAGLNGRMNVVDFSFNWNDRYTFWSGITGGTFLALAYFGTDQSQAQRYISGQSIRESRLGLLFNGMLKVPMQFVILLAGVMVFVFYQFRPAPLFFNANVEQALVDGAARDEYLQLQAAWSDEHARRMTLYAPVLEGHPERVDHQALQASTARETEMREATRDLIDRHLPGSETNDRDYVFIRFVLDYLPQGIIGLLLTTILAAGMSSTASELNALASTTTIDFYKRLIRPGSENHHLVRRSRWITVGWGIVAIGFARFASLFENLIQFVNIIGSVFYGTILGIFLCAFLIKRVRARAVFIGALLAEAVVLGCFWLTDIGFLWYNVIGCGVVVLVGLLLSAGPERLDSVQHPS